MRKVRIMLAAALFIGIFLFSGTGDPVCAAELAETQEQSTAADTRPDYTIYVNRVLNCITIKQQNEDGSQTPVKAMVCSCGREGSETPEGIFRTSNYYTWRKMVDATYARYAVRFNGKILFHSVPYIEESPDTLEWEEYNKLGENASLGCVRLSVEDAKWIYDNCKQGTTVVVYSDTEETGELGKPTATKIEESSPNRGWDPTDARADNPWLGGKGLYTPFLGSMDDFDYRAYADQYPDLREAFGYDKEALYGHYIAHGINEGRIGKAL